MKKLFLGILMISLAQQALAGQKIEGIDSNGYSFVPEPPVTKYIRHGGCRPHGKGTEAWLQLLDRRNPTFGTDYPQFSYGYPGQQAVLFLASSMNSIESLAVCSFLKSAMWNQIPVVMELVQNGSWLYVKSLDQDQVLQHACTIRSPSELDNFQEER